MEGTIPGVFSFILTRCMEYYKRLFSFVLIPVTSVISQNVKSMICFTFHLSADLVTVPNNSDNTFLVNHNSLIFLKKYTFPWLLSLFI